MMSRACVFRIKSDLRIHGRRQSMKSGVHGLLHFVRNDESPPRLCEERSDLAIQAMTGSLPRHSRVKTKWVDSRIDGSVGSNVGHQGRACRVKRRFFTEHVALKKAGLHPGRPQALPGGDDLVLHDGRRCSQIEQVHRAIHNIGQAARRVPQCQRVGVAFHQHGQVKCGAHARIITEVMDHRTEFAATRWLGVDISFDAK